MNVRMPDGTLIRNVPEGTTKAELTAKLAARGAQIDAGTSEFAGLDPPARGELAARRLDAPSPTIPGIARNVGMGVLQAAGDIPAGLEQIGMRAGGALGIVPPAAKTASERRIAEFERVKRGITAQPGGGAGYLGGQVATAFVPGLGPSAAAGRIATMAKPLAVGAGITAARPHETEAARAKAMIESAAYGGAALAGFKALGMAGRGVKRAFTGGEVIEATGERTSRATAAQNRGYILTTGEISGNKRLQGLEGASENMLGGTALARIRAHNKENTNRILSKRIGGEAPELSSDWLSRTGAEIGEEFQAVRNLDAPPISFRPGYKILYRGGTGTGKGRWYTDDIEHAKRFGDVHAIEVPVDVANMAQRKAQVKGVSHYEIPSAYTPTMIKIIPPIDLKGTAATFAKAIESGKLAGSKKIGRVVSEFKKRYPRQMTWNEYADLRSEWAQTVVGAKDRDFASRLGSLIGALDDAAVKTAPDAAQLKDAARRYREYALLRDSVDENGDIVAGKFVREVGKMKRGAYRTTKSGEDELIDVARTLATFKNQIPTSGTAERLQAMKTIEAIGALPGRLVRGGLGIGGGLAAGDITGIGGILSGLLGGAVGYAAPHGAQKILLSPTLRKYLTEKAPRTRELARTKSVELLSRAMRLGAVTGGL